MQFKDIDNQGSRLTENSDGLSVNASIGYLLFDLSDLVMVDDQNLVILKIYADNSSNLEEELAFASGRVLEIADGTSPSGFLSPPENEALLSTGPGFALFNLTGVINAMQQYDQKSIGIFFAGEDMSIGTIESGKPAEIIVV